MESVKAMQNTGSLALRPIGWIGSGPDMRHWKEVFQYEVERLPAGEEAWIARMHGCWQILRCTNGVSRHWTGEYSSPNAALAALENALGIRRRIGFLS